MDVTHIVCVNSWIIFDAKILFVMIGTPPFHISMISLCLYKYG